MKRIFISYSHEDEPWKDRLESHLKVLEFEGISLWSDRQIGAGEEWKKDILKAMDEADVAILLVSKHFLGSQFIKTVEVPRLLERRETAGTHILPLIVDQCPWKTVSWLSAIQVRPKDGTPLTRLGDDNLIEDNLVAFVEEIGTILNQLNKLRGEKASDKNGGAVRTPSGPGKKSGAGNIEIPCKSPPVTGAILNGLMALNTENNEWFLVDLEKERWEPLPEIYRFSSWAINNNDELVLGLFEHKVARLKNNNWVYTPWESPVLSIANTEMGGLVGDANGKITLLNSPAPMDGECTVPEPVIDLIPLPGQGLVILGQRGGLWTTEWPFAADSGPEAVATGDFGRVFNIFPAAKPYSVLFMSRQKIGLYNFHRKQLEAVSRSFTEQYREELRTICFSHKGKDYAVLTDQRKLYLVSQNLKNVKLIEFSDEEPEVSGIATAPEGGFLVWTTLDNLFTLGENRMYKKISAGNIKWAGMTGDGTRVVIRWLPEAGTHIQLQKTSMQKDGTKLK